MMGARDAVANARAAVGANRCDGYDGLTSTRSDLANNICPKYRKFLKAYSRDYVRRSIGPSEAFRRA